MHNYHHGDDDIDATQKCRMSGSVELCAQNGMCVVIVDGCCGCVGPLGPLGRPGAALMRCPWILLTRTS